MINGTVGKEEHKNREVAITGQKIDKTARKRYIKIVFSITTSKNDFDRVKFQVIRNTAKTIIEFHDSYTNFGHMKNRVFSQKIRCNTSDRVKNWSLLTKRTKKERRFTECLKQVLQRLRASSTYVIGQIFWIARHRKASSMRKRKMCVRTMEDNEDDRVVNVIINYFTTRVNTVAQTSRINLINSSLFLVHSSQ